MQLRWQRFGSLLGELEFDSGSVPLGGSATELYFTNERKLLNIKKSGIRPPNLSLQADGVLLYNILPSPSTHPPEKPSFLMRDLWVGAAAKR
jgi:hypothetical protein